MPLRFVNLTPHPVNIDGLTFESEGRAWCDEHSHLVPGADVLLIRRTYGAVTGLPEPQPGVMYIVSAIVRQRLPERTDLATPVRLVRDGQGGVIGCRALVVN